MIKKLKASLSVLKTIFSFVNVYVFSNLGTYFNAHILSEKVRDY